MAAGAGQAVFGAGRAPLEILRAWKCSPPPPTCARARSGSRRSSAAAPFSSTNVSASLTASALTIPSRSALVNQPIERERRLVADPPAGSRSARPLTLRPRPRAPVPSSPPCVDVSSRSDISVTSTLSRKDSGSTIAPASGRRMRCKNAGRPRSKERGRAMTFFRDPRDYQISVLGGLLVYGLPALDFDVGIVQVAVTLASVLLIQYACTRLWRPAAVRSEERADLRAVAVPAAAHELPAGSCRVAARHHHRAASSCCACNGKHVFNPTNFGIVDAPADHEHGLGVAGTVGQRRVLRVPDGLPRRTRRPPRAAQRRRDCVRRSATRPAVRPLVLSRRADGDSDPPAAERRAAAVHVLHDFRPAHHARRARRTLRSSPRWSRSARGTCSSACSARTACSGRSRRARCSCRSSTG